MNPRLLLLFFTLTLLPFTLPPTTKYITAQTIGTTKRVSVSSQGSQSNNSSSLTAISDDGRFIAFYSNASNLVPNDTNNQRDIFVRDQQTGQTTRVSIASDGTQGNGQSSWVSMSSDGRFIAFDSVASNLVSNDTNGVPDSFIHDRQTGQTTRVSVSSNGVQANDGSVVPFVSASGRFVAFRSYATNLVSGDTNNNIDSFIHDRQTGKTERISIASDGTQGNGFSDLPSVSEDGRFIAFWSSANNLVPNDTNTIWDVFVRDRETGQTTRVSVASDGTQGNKGSVPTYTAISRNGRYIAFYSEASNLVNNDTNAIWDVFVHDRETGQTTRVSVASDGAQGNGESIPSSISPDGRYVSFSSLANNLVSGDTNEQRDIFVRDRETGQTTRVSVASDGAQGNGESTSPSLSVGGRFIAYTSSSTNLVPGDTNGYIDVFVHDRLGSNTAFTLSPIYPSSHETPSIVMQGGTVHRYFRLLDGNGSPISDAIITFSIGNPSITDAQGYFTYTATPSNIVSPGSYLVSIQSIISNGNGLSVDSLPRFGIDMSERQFSHSWGYGASVRAKGGISSGIIAYVQRETSGGLELVLEERNANTTTDDVVLMKEDYSDIASVGIGLGQEVGASIVILDVRGGASAVLSNKIRTFGHTTARFPNPYIPDDKRAQSIFLLRSIINSAANAMPSKPFGVALLKTATERNVPYSTYITEQQGGISSSITQVTVNVGASASIGLKRNGTDWKGKIIGFDIVDAGLEVIKLDTFTDYRDRNEVGLASEAGFDLELSALSGQVSDIKNKLIGIIGERSRKIRFESILDADTEQLKRLEISLIGEGNSSIYNDVAKEEVTVKIILPANRITPVLLEQTVNVLRLIQASQETGNVPLDIGTEEMVNELNVLFTSLDYIEYEVLVGDGAETSFETSISVNLGVVLELGPGFSVKKMRTLVRERGVFLSGRPYLTEIYSADQYVSRPGKTWNDLTLNALGGLWEYVKDAFNWVVQEVIPLAGWSIGVNSRTRDGIDQGGAKVIVQPGSQMTVSSSVVGLQNTPITVSALGWVPSRTASAHSTGLKSTAVTSAAEDFAVGGVYAFEPSTLIVSPTATLVMTYTDDAVARIDESRLGLFQWNAMENNWQLLTAQADTTNNTFTASITQLGTFALGYDSVTPQVTIVAPVNGSSITNRYPIITAVVTDAGVGIDPSSVQLQVDGEPVQGYFDIATGELTYLPMAPLQDGVHFISVTAKDMAGNASLINWHFSVDNKLHVYLPMVAID